MRKIIFIFALSLISCAPETRDKTARVLMGFGAGVQGRGAEFIRQQEITKYRAQLAKLNQDLIEKRITEDEYKRQAYPYLLHLEALSLSTPTPNINHNSKVVDLVNEDMPFNQTPVYTQSQCIGAQVMGQCHGGVIGAPKAICHGTMINGQCMGTLMPR